MRKLFQVTCLGIFAFALLISCVKDTNFDNAEEIAITPVVEANFVFFNFNGSDFFDSQNNIPRLVVRDTTEIKFFDDGGFQDGLKRVEFFFKYTNSIPRNFDVTYRFLSAVNDTTLTFQNSVNAGTNINEVITESTRNIEGAEVTNLTMSNKVVVIVTIPSADQNLAGALKLQSKGTFYLEF